MCILWEIPRSVARDDVQKERYNPEQRLSIDFRHVPYQIFLNINDPLVPPNPKELDKTTLIFIDRAV